MTIRAIAAMAMLSGLASAGAAKQPVAPTEVKLNADTPLLAEIEGVPARLQIVSGFVDRLTLHTAFVEANGIKPAAIMGNANVSFWGRKEFKGKNRPLEYEIEGVKENGRAFWFYDVPQPVLDGTIGPFAIPFDIVTLGISPPQGNETAYDLAYIGSANNGSNGGYADPTFKTTIRFAVEKKMQYPLASAATGAAIAAAYGGTLTGDEWQQEIAFGVERPVRLMTLERPFVIGSFRISKIAVRVRSSHDAGGSGEAIADAEIKDEDVDPAEIVVTAPGKKARAPLFTLEIGREYLDQCDTIRFDKVAKKISLSCRPA